MKNAEELLALTYDFKSAELSRIPFRNETYLYNCICLMLWKLGEKEYSIKTYRKLVEYFLNRRVSSKYYFRSLGILLGNMSDKMERLDWLEESKYWTNIDLKRILMYGKGSNVEWLLSNLVCIAEKQGYKREFRLEIAKCTLGCSELFKQERFCEITRKYICEHFEEE